MVTLRVLVSCGLSLLALLTPRPVLAQTFVSLGEVIPVGVHLLDSGRVLATLRVGTTNRAAILEAGKPPVYLHSGSTNATGASNGHILLYSAGGPLRRLAGATAFDRLRPLPGHVSAMGVSIGADGVVYGYSQAKRTMADLSTLRNTPVIWLPGALYPVARNIPAQEAPWIGASEAIGGFADGGIVLSAQGWTSATADPDTLALYNIWRPASITVVQPKDQTIILKTVRGLWAGGVLFGPGRMVPMLWNSRGDPTGVAMASETQSGTVLAVSSTRLAGSIGSGRATQAAAGEISIMPTPGPEPVYMANLLVLPGVPGESSAATDCDDLGRVAIRYTKGTKHYAGIWRP